MNHEWIEITLDEVCSKITDGAHHSPKSVDNGLPMASVKDMTPFGLNLQSARKISIEDFTKLVKQGCQPLRGDVLIAKDGNSALDTVCLVKETQDVVLLSSVAILRPNQEVIYPDFLRLYLDAEPTRNYLKASSISGAAIPRVILQDFKRAKIRLPKNIDIQKKIADTVANYDNLIENNNRRIAILEDMAQSLYREWFVKFRFPGHENVKLVDSMLGKVPEGWETIDLGEEITIKKGKNITKKTITDGEIPVVAGGLSPAYYHNQANTKAPVVTISASGANAGFVNLYHSPVWASDCSYIDEDVSPFVYFYYLLLKDRQYEISRMQTGAAQPHVYPKDLMRLVTTKIPTKFLKDFNDEITPVFKLIANLSKRNENLIKQRDMLLPKLISGKVQL